MVQWRAKRLRNVIAPLQCICRELAGWLEFCYARILLHCHGAYRLHIPTLILVLENARPPCADHRDVERYLGNNSPWICLLIFTFLSPYELVYYAFQAPGLTLTNWTDSEHSIIKVAIGLGKMDSFASPRRLLDWLSSFDHRFLPLKFKNRLNSVGVHIIQMIMLIIVSSRLNHDVVLHDRRPLGPIDWDSSNYPSTSSHFHYRSFYSKSESTTTQTPHQFRSS